MKQWSWFMGPLFVGGVACAASENDVGSAPSAGGSAGVSSGGSAGSPFTTGGSGGAGGGLAIDASPGGGAGFVGIPETCAQSDAAKSYIGCEYWPTITLNSGLSPVFEFAIAAANPAKTTAQVKVEKAGKLVAEASIEPGKLATLTLPWDEALKQTRSFPSKDVTSARVVGGAFHVQSSVPIVLYQFNPLDFSKPIPATGTCQIDLDSNSCLSFSNDASLLLPASALGNDYVVVTRPSFHLGNEFGSNIDWSDYPSFVAVTATADDTHVVVKSKARVRSGPGVGEATPGTPISVTLDAGDVVLLAAGNLPHADTEPPGKPCAKMQIFGGTYHLCTSGDDYDFTGSRVTSDKPISVIGGHDCAMVPHGLWACDHLEESMIPVESLGTELVVTAVQSTTELAKKGATDPMYVRVVSAGPNNQLEFDPPGIHAKATLGDGEWLEIGPVTQDFVVRGSHRLLIAQFMTGKNTSGTKVKGEVGDPASSLAIPAEQFRRELTFLAPATYTHNFVNIVSKKGALVSVDGAQLAASEFEAVGSTDYVVARHAVGGGAHTVEGSEKVGIVVYGYGLYTSYMYPGGLNLEKVSVIPK